MRFFLLFGGLLLSAANPVTAQDVPMREFQTKEGQRVRLDLTNQVLRITVPEDKDWARADNDNPRAEAPLLPTLPVEESAQFISAAVLALKAKQFDDGLYAAVELAAETGLGDFAGKTALLKTLTQLLGEQSAKPTSTGRDVIFAAALLSSVIPSAPAAFESAAREQIKAFLANELRSKPIGFYTWSPELTKIFQQDRLLQTEIKDVAEIEALARALHRGGPARQTYEKYLTLVSKLTNPLAKADLRPQLAALDGGAWKAPDGPIAFFPPSIAPETELIKRLYGNKPIPEGFNLVDEMIRRIQAGQLSLKPTPQSGWYDHQLWSFEPLVTPDQTPEAKHLKLDESYRKQLLELFKGLITLTRETHIKQLEIPLVGSAAPNRDPQIIISIAPELSTEPLATHYARRAQAYHFVRQVIADAFGPDALKQMHRLMANGASAPTLHDELNDMEALFQGASGLVNRQLGVKSQEAPANQPPPADLQRFQAWMRELAADADLKQDARTMVPVFYDLQRQKTKVWLMLGWATRPVHIEFEQKPAVEVFDAAGKKLKAADYKLEFHSTTHQLVYPVTAEVYVSRLLNRDEFRKHCDQYKTRGAILKNLK